MSVPNEPTSPLAIVTGIATANLSTLEEFHAENRELLPNLGELSKDELLQFVAHGASETRNSMALLLHGIEEMERRGWGPQMVRAARANQ